jgi:hypothetical protein
VLVTLLVPVSAILLGVLILGETIASRQFAGLALIASGLMIIDGRVIQFLRDRYAGAGLVQRPEASSLAVDDKRPLLSGSASRHMLNEPHHFQ